jgi:DNA-binding MarR family transcriptional regulator
MIKKNFNNSIIFHIIRLSETIKKHGDTLTEKYGITTQQWIIMLLLAKDPNIIYLQENPSDKPLSAKDIAEAMNVSRANITNLLNVLIDKKLITQTFDGTDKRRKRIILTPTGENIVKALEGPRKKRNDDLFKNFNKEEKESFIAFIQSALSFLKRDMVSKT